METNQLMNVMEFVHNNNVLRRALEKEVSRTFFVNSRPYWDGMYGFDIVGFDKNVICSGDRGPCEVAAERWGEGAAVLIRQALGSVPLTLDQIEVACETLSRDYVERYAWIERESDEEE